MLLKGNMKLGVDLGNIIIDHLTFGTTEEFFRSGNYNAIPPVEGALDGLQQLNKLFSGNVHIIYNATNIADTKIHSWLNSHNFSRQTGIPMSKIVRSKQKRDKSAYCIGNGITHFVDDRLEVLGYLTPVVKNLYLLRGQRQEVAAFRQFSQSIIAVDTWPALIERIHEQIKH